ncbi:hypothetical protein L614_002400000200 [Ochrobactrum sp. J50]|uniref:DUF7946 domain-containing protein n=1 Tax=Ochrobactrum sp. J50 TaxID=936132 RepID=UPI0011AA6F6D|nr:hypothetical protein [Ochrobactrum sp. J50]TWH01415.1 hypothetical protein L614_002400000200 [Ochrobactrum sp. J50]
MGNKLVLKFDGGKSATHVIGLGELGRSLTGIDRIATVGLVLFAERRIPKKREKSLVMLVAEEPKKSSVAIPLDLQSAPWLLPLVNEFIAANGAELLKQFISWVLLHLGGRKKEADVHFQALMDLTKTLNASHDEREARWHETLLSIVDRMAPYARDAVAPVGQTARSLSIGPTGGAAVAVIDEPTADAIRARKGDEVEDLIEMTVTVDGISHHKQQIQVENPEEPGKFINADVRDPAMDIAPNIYSEAANVKGQLLVQAKKVRREGRLHRLYIMDAKMV